MKYNQPSFLFNSNNTELNPPFSVNPLQTLTSGGGQSSVAFEQVMESFTNSQILGTIVNGTISKNFTLTDLPKTAFFIEVYNQNQKIADILANGTKVYSITFPSDTTTLAVKYFKDSDAVATTLISILVTGNSTITEGTSQVFSAVGTYSNGSVINVTSLSTFTTTEGTFAGSTLTVPSNAVVGDGRSLTVTATSSGISGSKSVSVLDGTGMVVTPTLSSIVISGANSINEGATSNYSVIATYSDASTTDITNSATYNIIGTGATINSSGMLTVSTNATASDGRTITLSVSYGGLSSNNKIVTIVDTSVAGVETLVFRDTFPNTSGSAAALSTIDWRYVNQDGVDFDLGNIVVKATTGKGSDTPLNAGYNTITNLGWFEISNMRSQQIVFTSKYTINRTGKELTKIQFYSYNYNNTIQVAPLVKIGTRWFRHITLKVAPETVNNWDEAAFSISASLFTWIFDGTTSAQWVEVFYTPNVSVVQDTVPISGLLPAGNITSFGMYTKFVENNTDFIYLRTDNYEVYTT